MSKERDTDYQHSNPGRDSYDGCMLFTLILMLPTSVLLAVLEWGANMLCGRIESPTLAFRSGVVRGRIFAASHSVCGEMRLVDGKLACCCLSSVRCGCGRR